MTTETQNPLSQTLPLRDGDTHALTLTEHRQHPTVAVETKWTEYYLHLGQQGMGTETVGVGIKVSNCCASGFRTQNKGLHDACPGSFCRNVMDTPTDCGCPCHTVKDGREAVRAAFRQAARECAVEPECESAVLELKVGGKTWQIAFLDKR